MPSRRFEESLQRRGGMRELLRLPAMLFGAGARVRGALYDRGLLGQFKLEVPVISVGNLSVGGTGKTPLTAWLVAELLRLGRRPGILARGYGAADDQLNDEGRLLAMRFPDVPQVQVKDRVAGGEELVRLGVDVIVLDDGFQHRRLVRDLDLVLIDATRPYGLPAAEQGAQPVRAFLPRGFLREETGALRRAHGLVLTRTEEAGADVATRLETELCAEHADLPCAWAGLAPRRVRRMPEGTVHACTTLAGRPLDLLSAIGNPESFERTAAGLGATIHEHRRFPDHHTYVAEDLVGLGEAGRTLLTTEKDAPKLTGLGSSFEVLEVDFHWLRGAPVIDNLLAALPESAGQLERRALHAGLSG